MSFWTTCLSPWQWSDLSFILHSIPACHFSFCTDTKWEKSPNVCASFCDFRQSHPHPFSSGNPLFQLETRERRWELLYMWRVMKHQSGGQGRLSTRHSYTATAADCTSTPSLPSGRLWNALGNHLECKMQTNPLKNLYPACPTVVLLMKEEEGKQSKSNMRLRFPLVSLYLRNQSLNWPHKRKSRNFNLVPCPAAVSKAGGGYSRQCWSNRFFLHSTQ